MLGALEEEELLQVAAEASAAEASLASKGRTPSRHEDDTAAAAVLRRVLCTQEGAEARCKMGATDRKAGVTPVSTKRGGLRRRRKSDPIKP